MLRSPGNLPTPYDCGSCSWGGEVRGSTQCMIVRRARTSGGAFTWERPPRMRTLSLRDTLQGPVKRQLRGHDCQCSSAGRQHGAGATLPPCIPDAAPASQLCAQTMGGMLSHAMVCPVRRSAARKGSGEQVRAQDDKDADEEVEGDSRVAVAPEERHEATKAEENHELYVTHTSSDTNWILTHHTDGHLDCHCTGAGVH